MYKPTNGWVRKVRAFNKAYSVPKAPSIDSPECETQIALIEEEYNELISAYAIGDHIETLDAIADSIYVLIGLAEKLGYDLTGAFAEVHRSNMSKLGPDGKPIYRPDGKVLKGPDYFKPNLAPYI
ncbi:MAG: nucleoside triphosphate pyrophosphohydrolase family protein [Cloacibacillus sp.]